MEVQTSEGIRDINKDLDFLKESFEKYKDQVTGLEAICEAHEIVSLKLKDENLTYKMLIMKIKKLGQEGSLAEINQKLEGLNL